MPGAVETCYLFYYIKTKVTFKWPLMSPCFSLHCLYIFMHVGQKWKALPFYFLQDPIQHNSGKGLKWLFPTVNLATETFISSNCNPNCFLIHRYICFPILFLLLLLFLLKHTNIIQVFKFTSEKKAHMPIAYTGWKFIFTS